MGERQQPARTSLQQETMTLRPTAVQVYGDVDASQRRQGGERGGCDDVIERLWNQVDERVESRRRGQNATVLRKSALQRPVRRDTAQEVPQSKRPEDDEYGTWLCIAPRLHAVWLIVSGARAKVRYTLHVSAAIRSQVKR